MLLCSCASIREARLARLAKDAEASVEAASISEAEPEEDAMLPAEADTVSSDAADDEPAIEDNDPPRAEPSEEGINEESFRLIEEIIETDVKYGFPGAQLAVMRHGRLVYENAWGKTCAYEQDGSVKQDSPDTTVDTMYDLASITKMFGTNYALQKLVTDGKLDLDEHVVSYLGDRFADDVIYIDYDEGETPDLDVQREWKRELTIRNLLRHEAGFPADPRYCNPHLDTEGQDFSLTEENLLFAGSGADKETKEATIEAICKTPLMYKPGTKTAYSDVDYMILGTVVEQITGRDLDTYLKEEFLWPLGLKYVTYAPLEHGFTEDDCAATELNGNTRDNLVYFDGIRTYTLQGEVHDEKAWYSMGGISGHAGLFANARDAAWLANIMLTDKEGDSRFFSKEVIDEFTYAGASGEENWGLGWWRQGDQKRKKYFGSKAGADTFGHQGWTGTLIMIDPEKDLVIAFFTNKINTPLTDKDKDPNKFNGNWYTTASLGFVPEILYAGLDRDGDISAELSDIASELEGKASEQVTPDMGEDHPAVKNLKSKQDVVIALQKKEGVR